MLILLSAIPASAQTRTELFQRDRAEFICATPRRIEVGQRLEALKAEDQRDRSGAITAKVLAADLKRRQEVATLFAEGCFTTGADFYNAALVFQHGTSPEHFYQAYLWSKRAMELGNKNGTWLLPRAIDRFLMNSGYKQLFATNLVRGGYPSGVPISKALWCVWPTVSEISDSDRARRKLASMRTQFRAATRRNHGIISKECEVSLPDPPKGLFPGIW